MVNFAKRKGTAFESRFVADLLKDDKAIKAGRFYASKGETDVWWVDQNGVHNEAQLKYASRGKRLRNLETPERLRLQKFAHKVYPQIKVWIVRKAWRKPAEWELVSP